MSYGYYNKKHGSGKVKKPSYNSRIDEMNKKRPDIPFGVLIKPVNINDNISKNDDIAGIYGIYDKLTGTRLYVGSSINVYNRMHEHIDDIRKHKHSRSDLNDYNPDNLVFMLLTRCYHHINDYNPRSSGRNELSYEEMRQFLLVRPLKFGITPDYIDVHADAPSCIKVFRKSHNHDVRIVNMIKDDIGKYCFYYKHCNHDDIILKWHYYDFNTITDYSRCDNSSTNEMSTMLANIFETASHDKKLAYEYGVPFISDADRMQAYNVDMMIKQTYCNHDE